MQIRLGYVAMSIKLENCSPSKTITLQNLQKIEDEEAKISRLKKITKENLQNCLRLLYYNIANGIKVFRFTSKIVPLATHPITEGWDYISDFQDDLHKIGQVVRDNGMRVSAHPDHFTLLNSPKEEVLEASMRDLWYHHKVFSAMGLPDAEMVMHVGGLYGSRETSIQRFQQNFKKLPEPIARRIRLENDDKSFDAIDILGICNELHIPMVLDIHHFDCLNSGESLEDVLAKAFDTWDERRPKLHFSSPRDHKNFRAHADDIDGDKFMSFLYKAKKVGRDIDVMLEAKNKDVALFNLLETLKTRDGGHNIQEASFEF